MRARVVQGAVSCVREKPNGEKEKDFGCDKLPAATRLAQKANGGLSDKITGTKALQFRLVRGDCHLAF